jgi:predicted transcriptional regulator of viral defense system
VSVMDREIFQTVGELEIAFAHCLEASDYCGQKTPLLKQLREKLEFAYRWRKISKPEYEKLLLGFEEE